MSPHCKISLSAAALSLLALAAAHPASAQTTVTVGSLNSGNGGNIIPFGQDSRFAYPEEYQQIYGASAFSAPLAITSVSFASLLGSQSLTATYDLTVGFSQTAATPAAPSSTFADNVGPGYTTVFRGTVTRTLLGTGNIFDLTIPTSAFSYDPSKGNLLLDIVVDTPPVVNSASSPSFAADLNPNLSRVGTFGGNTFAEGGYGLVTQFGTGSNNFQSGPPAPAPVSAAPEPSQTAALGLTTFGVLGLVLRASRRTRTA